MKTNKALVIAALIAAFASLPSVAAPVYYGSGYDANWAGGISPQQRNQFSLGHLVEQDQAQARERNQIERNRKDTERRHRELIRAIRNQNY